MEELTATADPAGRSALLAKAQTIISEDYVNGYLFELAYTSVVKADLQGMWENQPTASVDVTALSWAE
jgi:peptide/nickel transport system substrate-binding protein